MKITISLFIYILAGGYLAYLLWEGWDTRRQRRRIAHLVYVNGTRGKSTVTRLIDGGLRGGGLRVFCKTTGTLPMIIDTGGVEKPLRRRGPANIGEQRCILRRAAQEGAQVLVIECMALDPYLQWFSQHRMLRADVGVITNVRMDHRAEMGNTLEDICRALCTTIPEKGRIFTADSAFFPQIQAAARQRGSEAILALPQGEEKALFPENEALALAVCQALGVGREAALSGMAGYKPDPFSLSIHRFPGGAIFVNALSVNDPQSTELALERVVQRQGLGNRRLILLLNNRQDRGYRTRDLLELAKKLTPAEVWLLGGAQAYARRVLRALYVPIRCFKTQAELPLGSLGEQDLIFAAGNIAGDGIALMERVRKEAQENV